MFNWFDRVNDTFATSTEIYQVYEYTIVNYANESYLLKQYWPMVVCKFALLLSFPN